MASGTLKTLVFTQKHEIKKRAKRALRQTKWGFSFNCTRQRHSKPSIAPFRSTKRISFLHFGHSYLEGINPSFMTQSRTALFPCCPSKRKNPVVALLSLNFLAHAILTTGAKSIKPKIGTRGEESMSRVELDLSQQGQGRK
ncbi:hypothetical protein TNCV_4859961 [Trichonephila clavipes]|nr:hypothetical protein TNCV_4859961 [Trichonephila clavipes]